MRVTIKTIAEKCGISPVTVSRVIARSPNVSEKTRQLVMQTMQEMGYWQKNLEDPTKKDVPQIVALMVEDITDKAQYILQAAAEFFLNSGYLAIICDRRRAACGNICLPWWTKNMSKGRLWFPAEDLGRSWPKLQRIFRTCPLLLPTGAPLGQRLTR